MRAYNKTGPLSVHAIAGAYVVLLGIDERTAALWEAGSWRALGDGGVTVITCGDRNHFASGEAIEGLPAPSTG